MLKVQETTKWTEKTPNHIYFLDDSKSRMFGYISAVSGKEQWFEGKRGFDARRRTFTVLATLPDLEKAAPSVKQWKVAGSKGAEYTVTNDNGNWSCTCPAALYGKQECKHITATKEK